MNEQVRTRTTKDAKRAAEILLELQDMHQKRDVSAFGLLSINMNMNMLHVQREALDIISDRNEWVWTGVGRRNRFDYFRATVEMHDVEFCAIFDNYHGEIKGEAESYGCPQSTIDEFI